MSEPKRVPSPQPPPSTNGRRSDPRKLVADRARIRQSMQDLEDQKLGEQDQVEMPSPPESGLRRRLKRPAPGAGPSIVTNFKQRNQPV